MTTMFRQTRNAIALTSVFAIFSGTAHAQVTSADVVFLVDESGSMSTEHAFLVNQIASLDTGLQGAGVTTRNYGLVGFGGNVSSAQPRDITGGLVGLASAQTALGSLTVSGGLEDGWAAMDYALTNYTFTGQATNFILVSDEDRDVLNNYNTLNYNGVLSSLQSKRVVLNAVVNANLTADNNSTALGISSDGSAYLADGSGGFTTGTGGTCASGFGTTCADYVDMALATSGAAWDLNQLRAGGLLADSFTAAFLDIKVQEIITPPVVPLPAAVWMLGAGILGYLGLGRTRRDAPLAA